VSSDKLCAQILKRCGVSVSSVVGGEGASIADVF
jgi:hypothetical protein